MTVEEVKELIDEIVSFEDKGDFEVSHSKEDDLYVKVLRSIAADPSNAQELAKEALRTQDILTNRWYG